MALSNDDHLTIPDYLLGHLSDEEQGQIEERLMIDDSLFEEMEISKGELIEEYFAGELNQDERQWFENNYLASTEGRERHALALAISGLKQREPAPVHKPSFSEKLAAFWSRPSWAVPVAVSAVLIVVVAGIWLSKVQQPGTTVSVALINTQISRSNGDTALPPRVNLPRDTGELRASLALPKPFPQGTRFQAVLDNQTDRKRVNVVDHKENAVTVAIPAQELPRGEYALELTALKTDGTEEAVPGSYRFDVN